MAITIIKSTTIMIIIVITTTVVVVVAVVIIIIIIIIIISTNNHTINILNNSVGIFTPSFSYVNLFYNRLNSLMFSCFTGFNCRNRSVMVFITAKNFKQESIPK